MAHVFARGRYALRRLLSPYPRLFLPIMRLRPAHEGQVIDGRTEIVIEGFPRSGNTFAVAAFQLAQGRPVRIARHLHAPAHVIEGVRRGIPTILLLRDPADAVVSQVIRHPDLTLEAGLREYIGFHRPLLPFRDRFVLGSFDQVTQDFGAVIDALNHKFGTSFQRFEHTRSNEQAVFDVVDQMEREDRTRRAEEAESTVARPTDHREKLKATVRNGLDRPRTARLLVDARALSNRFEEVAGG